MVTTDEELIKLLGGKDNKKMSKIEKRLYEGDWNSAIELTDDGKLVVYNRSKTSLGVNYTEIPLENTKENISVKGIYKNIVESNSGLPSKRGEIAEVKDNVLYVAEGFDTFNNIFAPLSNYEERR